MIDYLDWTSRLSLDDVFASKDTFSYPHLLNDGSGRLIYLTSLDQDKGRSVLMLVDRGQRHCITPGTFSLRTKINEYGGKPYWVFDNEIVFANQEDQCLYRQTITDDGSTAPTRLSTPSSDDTLAMYADLNRLHNGAYLGIVEREYMGSNRSQNTMAISVVNANGGGPVNVLEGADFYSNLVVDCRSMTLAWVQWQHPNMPWDECELWVADFSTDTADVTIENVRRVSLEPGASVCQLIFACDGRLFFSVDYSDSSGPENYWNVHVYDLTTHALRRVTQDAREYGYPHWVYGDHRIAQLDQRHLITVASDQQSDTLVLIDTETLSTSVAPIADHTFQALTADRRGTALALVRSQQQNTAIRKFSLHDSTLSPSDVIAVAMPLNDGISVGEHISFATRDGEHAYGFYYPPRNTAYTDRTDPDARPPLMVMVHGGPTARAYGFYDAQKQFWTSRGFAILDVNHRGSTGYGRAYRDSLYGHWGQLDCSDIVDGITALAQQGKIDPERVCIRGKSAGGYAVLRALTEFPDVFRAGASYYGIGNLTTLAEVTHKFEKYYTDRLIGETYSQKESVKAHSRYVTRSPIHKLGELNSSMIVFQGALDRVVPVSVAREVINALESAGIHHVYVEYADEGHGFRQIGNNIDAWSRELTFYQDVLRLDK